jgi:hypothetical protein
MLPPIIDPKKTVEDLSRPVTVHGADKMGNVLNIAVQETANPDAVINRTPPGPSTHEKLVPGGAKRVLTVHQEQTDAQVIFRDRSQAIPGRVLSCLLCQLQIWNAPHLVDQGRIKMVGDRQLSLDRHVTPPCIGATSRGR